MRPFDPEGSVRLEHAWMQWQRAQENPQDGGGRFQVERGSYTYDIDLPQMLQTNRATRRTRRLRRPASGPLPTASSSTANEREVQHDTEMSALRTR